MRKLVIRRRPFKEYDRHTIAQNEQLLKDLKYEATKVQMSIDAQKPRIVRRESTPLQQTAQRENGEIWKLRGQISWLRNIEQQHGAAQRGLGIRSAIKVVQIGLEKTIQEIKSVQKHRKTLFWMWIIE